jgi:hypothetical protein
MSNNSKIINEMKTSLIKYFDTIKSKIEVKSQKIQANIDNDKDKCPNDAKVVEYQNLILKLNDNFIKLIDQIFDKNMKQINELKSDEIDKFKITSLNTYCYYVDNNQMTQHNKYKSKYPLGILIVTDWFLTRNEINYLRSYHDHGIIANSLKDLNDSNKASVKELAQIKKKSSSDEDENDNMDISDEYSRPSYISDSDEDEVPSLISKLKEKLAKSFHLKLDNNLINLYFLFNNSERGDDQKMTKVDEIENIIHLNKQEILDQLSKADEFFMFNSDRGYLINEICADAFINLRKVEKFSLHTDDIKGVRIHKDAFRGLTNLKKLELDLSKTYDIFDASVIDFSYLPNLEELCLQRLRTNNLKTNLLSGLSKLKHLKIAESHVKNIDFDFFHKISSKLETLNLRELVIVYGYSNLFTGMSSLKSLDFTQTKIDICKDSDDVEYIDLDKHVLKNMPALIKLEVDWDNFENIFHSKCQLLKKIEDLSLFFNHSPNNCDNALEFTSINSKYFATMNKLKNVKFEIDEKWPIELVLKKTFFNTFKKQFHQIESLEISNAFESKIHQGAFGNFKNLKTLKLVSIGLEHVKRNYFFGLDNLENLDLSDNMMTRIDSNAFSDFTKLKSLDLNLNDLDECVQPSLFKTFAKKLEMLDLTGTCKNFKMGDLETFKAKFGFNSNIDLKCFKDENQEEKQMLENIKKMQELYDRKESKQKNESFIYYANSNDENSDKESDDESDESFDKDEFYSNLYDEKPHDSDGDDDSNNFGPFGYGSDSDDYGYGYGNDSDDFLSYAQAILNNSDGDKAWYQYTYLYN